MAKILFVVAKDELIPIVEKAIEKYRNDYASINTEKENSEIKIISQIYAEKVDPYSYNADIIVARGFTAVALKKLHPDIPVVELPITAIDVISSIITLQNENTNNEPIALVGFGDISHQAHIASQLCHVPVASFKYDYINKNDNDISMMLDKISSKGFRYIVGGARIVNMAKQKKLASSFIQCGQESIYLAIIEADYIAGIRRKERERAVHFETILNYSHEGIISTDMNNKIIHINSCAGKILDIDTPSCVGTNLEEIISDANFVSILNTKKNYSDELLKMKNCEIILTKVRTSLGNEQIGKVITFQNINKVQDTEIKIRSKLHQRGLIAKYSFSDIIGESNSINETIKKAKTFAKVSSNILIIGKTGTGKELFAQSIHNYSIRKSKPFVAVNCAAIPENLMESEFFGYVGGAFTGASKDGKVGFFELAHEGTIFLDEVSELPLNLQSKLLRIIQESEVMRIGADKIIPIDIRIICASNKDLKSLVQQGKFRQDLYYRLCILQLHLPCLCERDKDVLLLANHFIAQYVSSFSKNTVVLSNDAENLLLGYSWDGNIRELRNICEQLVVLNETGIISGEEVSAILPAVVNKEDEHSVLTLPSSSNLSAEREQFERNLIIKALKESNYNKTKAASLLCMNRSTLWKKLKEYNIECKTII